jgi:protein-L-isoaspartate(D-aspartate) O-methyltransferase
MGSGAVTAVLAGAMLAALACCHGPRHGLQQEAVMMEGRPAAFSERQRERDQMVARQIAGRGVRDPGVLGAMRTVPRHAFVPAGDRDQAYEDYPLAIGQGQTISQPYIVAFMTEAVALKPGQRVLEIGTGSGYQAAVLAELGVEVYTMDILEELARRAEATLRALGYGGVQVRAGNGWEGWPQAAPFDAILVTAAPDRVPPALVAQLKVGGRMIVPVGEGMQTLKLLEKRYAGVSEEDVLDVRFVPMIGDPSKR